MSFAYQWQRDGVDIAGATDTSYTTVEADVGHQIGVLVTATNAGGSGTALSATVEITEPPPPPSGIVFGLHTLSGYGGVASGKAPGTVLTGVGASDWTIDADGNLVPSGTYGAAKIFTQSTSYDLTYPDHTTVHISMLANAAHITSNAADNSGSNQLRNTLLINAAGTIIGRNCTINALGALWRVRPPALGWNPVTVTSEHPASGTDANGNPLRGGGLQIGCIAFDCSLFGSSAPLPVTFDAVTFTVSADVAHSNFLGYTSTAGYGVSATNCLFSNADTVNINNVQNGFDNRGGLSQFNHFYRVFRGHTGGMVGGAAQTRIWDNVFEGMASDANTLAGENLSVLRNHAFNFLFRAGSHPDSCQHLGTQSANITNFGEVAYNTWVRNTGVLNVSDAQGDFFDDTISPFTVAGCHVHHEIMLLTSRNNVVTTRFISPQINNCLCIFPMGNNSGSTVVPTISTAGAVSGATITDCVANGYSLGSATQTRCTTMPKVQATVAIALPNMVFGTDPGQTSRAEVIRQCTPANLAVASGGFKNPDGTWRGPLTSAGAYTDA